MPEGTETTQTTTTVDTATAATIPAAGTAEPTPAALTIDSYAEMDKAISMPEGIKYNAEEYAGLKDLAVKHQIPAAALKDLIEYDLKNEAEDAKHIAEAQARWALENQQKYGAELKNVETKCSRVLAELDKTGKFKELLALAGAEKHPATLEFLKTIGDNLLEKSSVNPNATAAPDKEVSLEDFN